MKQMGLFMRFGNLSHMCKQPKPIKIVSEYDQEIPRSQTADNPMAPRLCLVVFPNLIIWTNPFPF